MNDENKGSLPEIVKILKVKRENDFMVTFVLDKAMDVLPGQMIMVWLPGVDEKPMSVRKSGEKMQVTIEARGSCTKQITELKSGDTIGIRGPYGNGFTHEKDCIIVGGGVGMPPLASLYDQLSDKSVRIIQGARTKDRLLFTDIKDMKIATDDGSHGHKGFVTDILEEEIKSRKPKIVYTCGPELMMVKVMEICKSHGIDMEASLERYMRCGMGICGSCTCGKSLVCLDGPVFSINELENNPDFGKHALSKSAKKLSLKEYYGGK